MNAHEGNWWEAAKFGLFVHWGLYALLAGEYDGKRTDNIAEWIMHDLNIPVAEYEKLSERFTAEKFDADALVKLAHDTGMKYIVLTAKHHDGFAMYASEASGYNIKARTPFARDPAAELRKACDKYGIKLCFYYSQAQDWHDPDGFEAGKDNTGKNFRRYLDEKCIPQIKELLTKYGPIGLIWFDTPLIMTEEESKEMCGVVRGIQPECLISGRVGNALGDYMTTGDNFIPLLPYPKDFEVPATINDTWGYNKFDKKWKSAETLLRNLVKIVSRGGNYLLNVGPMADGSIPQQSLDVLANIGEFMRCNGESIYDTKPVPYYPYDISWGYMTARDYTLYIHVFDSELRTVELINMGNTPVKATLLADGRELPLRFRRTCEGDGFWRIDLPESLPEQLDSVIKVTIAEKDIIFEPIHE